MTVYQLRSRSWSDDDVRPSAAAATPFGERTPLGASRNDPPAVVRVRRNDPYSLATEPYRKELPRVVWGVSHQPLVGKCFYLPIPKIQQVSTTPHGLPDGSVQLQIRQVRFEMESGQIRWLVRRLTGVHVLRAEKIVPGVLNIWVTTTTDADRICNIMHQNVLFDCLGVFAPLCQEQRESMLSYMETRQFHTRSQRLPRELVSIVRLYSPPPATASNETRNVIVEPPQMPPAIRAVLRPMM